MTNKDQLILLLASFINSADWDNDIIDLSIYADDQLKLRRIPLLNELADITIAQIRIALEKVLDESKEKDTRDLINQLLEEEYNV